MDWLTIDGDTGSYGNPILFADERRRLRKLRRSLREHVTFRKPRFTTA